MRIVSREERQGSFATRASDQARVQPIEGGATVSAGRLVQNGLRYTPAGGRVSVGVESADSGVTYRVEVFVPSRRS